MTTLYKDNAVSKLATPLAIGATTLTVTAGQGDRFPVVIAPDICKLTLENASGAIENIKVTARAVGADSMTIEKAQDGTSDQAWTAGGTPSTDTLVELRLTAADFQETVAHPSDSTDAHAASAISFSPSGSIAATNVQAAIVELDSDLSSAVVSLEAAIAAVEASAVVTLDGDLNALAALSGTGVIERTGVESYGLIEATAFGKSILTSANAGAAITLLGGTSILGIIGSPINSVLSKSGAYSVLAADRGKLIDCTGTWSLTLISAATAGDGFVIPVRNSGTGVITIDPNSTEQIDAATTITLNAGESCLVVCNGTAWKTIGKSVPASGTLLGVYGRFTAGTSITATRPSGATKARIVVQGGGGSGTSNGGGGGAYAEAVKDVTGDLTVTVGGAASASSVSGSGFTTITAAGGANASAGSAGGTLPTTGDINIAGMNGYGYSGNSAGSGGSSFGGTGGAGGTSVYAGTGGNGQNGAFGGGGGGAGSGDYSGVPGYGGDGFVEIYWYK